MIKTSSIRLVMNWTVVHPHHHRLDEGGGSEGGDGRGSIGEPENAATGQIDDIKHEDVLVVGRRVVARWRHVVASGHCVGNTLR